MSTTPEPGIAASTPTVAEPKITRKLRLRIESELRKPENAGYLRQTAKYLMHTEVHTFAFSVAANVILLLTVTRQVFQSQMMYDVVLQVLRSYLPAGQDFIVRSVVALTPHRGMRLFSLAMLLVSSTGVFVPLEVALNRVWGFTTNRKYLGNQAISLVLAAGCGLLALISVAITAKNQTWLLAIFGSKENLLFRGIGFLIMKFFAFAASIAMFFLIYWLLPNGKVSAKSVVPGAVLTGLIWELSKYLYILALHWLDFPEVYGPFALSVTLMFWAFVSGLLLLGGAQFSVLRARQVSSSLI